MAERELRLQNQSDDEIAALQDIFIFRYPTHCLLGIAFSPRVHSMSIPRISSDRRKIRCLDEDKDEKDIPVEFCAAQNHHARTCDVFLIF